MLFVLCVGFLVYVKFFFFALQNRRGNCLNNCLDWRIFKESGYDRYPKPDRHLIDIFEGSGLCGKRAYEVFKTTIELADTVKKTPYEVDKKIWLVCSGEFYLDKEKKVPDKKKELQKNVLK